MTGNDQLQLSSYRLRWIAWRKTPGSQKCYRSSLKRSGTIRLSLRSVSQGPFWLSVCSRTRRSSEGNNRAERLIRPSLLAPIISFPQYRIPRADVLGIRGLHLTSPAPQTPEVLTRQYGLAAR